VPHIGGSDSDVTEDTAFLECDAAWIGKYLPLNLYVLTNERL